MPETCPECGESAVISDSLDGNLQQVCEACGTVVEEGGFQWDGEAFAISNSSDAYKPYAASLPTRYAAINSETRVVSHVQKMGVQQINCWSKALNLDSNTIKAAIQMFRDAYVTERFRKCRYETKMTLAAACVYATYRVNDWPLPLFQMCQVTDQKAHDLTRIFKELQRVMNFQVTYPTIESLISPICGNILSSSQEKQVGELVYLCKEAWLVSGRNRDIVLMSACYLVWQGADFLSRKKTTFQAFSKMNSFPVPKNNINKILKHMKTLLCALCKNLPWVSNVEESNIAFHIGDILKYQHQLFMKVLKSAAAGTDSGNEDEKEKERKRKMDFSVPPASKKKKKEPVECVDLGDTHCTSARHDLDDPELNDDDLPESSMHEHFRTPEEIRMIQQFQDKVD